MAGFFSGFSSRAAVQMLFPWCSSLTGPCWEWEHPAQRHFCILLDSVNQIWVGTYRVPVSHLMTLSCWNGITPVHGLVPSATWFQKCFEIMWLCWLYKESKLRWPFCHGWKMLWMFKHIKYTQSARWLCDLVMIGTPTDLLLNPISVGGSWTGKISSLPIIMWI